MMAGDEYYGDEITSGMDPRERADLRRDQLEDTFPCPAGCGSREPVRIQSNPPGCSDCMEFPRCPIHHIWTPCRACAA